MRYDPSTSLEPSERVTASALVIAFVAFVASALTFFSGFGLGTLLLPVFALFYPVQVAVASTAVVHFLNGLFKLRLVSRHADRGTVLRFGIPAIGGAILGAWVLGRLAQASPLARYSVAGIDAQPHPVKIVVGLLILATVAIELVPRFGAATVPRRFLPLGGALSGFLGGLSGMQGALRSAFLVRLGLSKQAFIGTGVVVAVLVDISRLGVYARDAIDQRAAFDYWTLGAAVLAAALGAVVGNWYLEKLTMQAVQRFVAAALAVVAIALIAGIL